MIPDTSSTPKASASNKRVPRTAPLRSARGAEVRICAGAGGDREAAVGLTAVPWHESNIVKQHQQRGLVLVWLSMSGLMIFSLRLSHLTNWAGEHCFKLASQHSLPGKPVEEFLILPTHLPKIRSLDHQTWTSWDPHPLKRSRCIPRFLKQIAKHQQKGIFQFPVSHPGGTRARMKLHSAPTAPVSETRYPFLKKRDGLEPVPPKKPCHQTIDFSAKGTTTRRSPDTSKGKKGWSSQSEL